MRSIDIVCPVYAEGDAVRIFHERLLSALAALTSRYVFRFIYVVDPAGDGTEAVLEDLVSADPRVEALVMSRRFGHQMALVAGLDASSGDAVVMLDSDLQHPPETILQFVEQWEQGGDIVQAIRTDGRDVASWKRLTSKWFYKTFMSVGSIELKSGAADFRLLSRRVVEVFRTEMREHSPFLRGLVSWVGFNVRYVPFDTAKRVAGRTKYRLSTLVEFAINGVTSFSRVPLRACVMVGMLIALLSIIYGIYSVVDALLFTRLVPGWATLITMVSLLGGIQLVFLGVLGEYIAVIFEEVKDRPRYLVARRLFRDDSSSPGVAPVESTAIPAKSKAHIDRR
jgi:dolichol-phosphate mannosyltransferase